MPSKTAPKKSATPALSPEQKAAARSAASKKAAATRKANAAKAQSAAKVADVVNDVQETAKTEVKAAASDAAFVTALESAEGKIARVRRTGDADPVEGKVAQADNGKDGGRRFKIGRRIVSVSDITHVEVVGQDITAASSEATAKPSAPSKPSETAKPATKVDIDEEATKAKDVIPAYIVNYVEQCGSTDPMAPMSGLPFVQDGRLYLQLEGRGGAARGAEGVTLTGLRPFLRDTNGGLGEKPKAVLQRALVALGFERAPFPYVHPDRGSTASSYYSMPLSDFPAEVHAEPRQSKRTAKAANRGRVSASTADVEIVPMDPPGSDEDRARLGTLRKAYDDARETWRNAAAKRVDKAKQDEYREATRAANAELLAHRRAMHAKNVAAAAKGE